MIDTPMIDMVKALSSVLNCEFEKT